MAKAPKNDTEEVTEFGAGIEAEDTEVSGDIQIELTEKEKLALEAEARREVAADIKASKKKEFKAAAKKRLQAEAMFKSGKDDKGEDLDTVELQLASWPKYIILDGTVYHSGRKYTKRKAVIAVLKDQMDRGWRQEAARLGERTDWVAQKQMVLSRGGLTVH